MIEAVRKEAVKQVGGFAHNSTAWLMAGLGISMVPFSQFIGGIFLAGFWASIIASRRNDSRKVWAIWLTAALAAIFVAQLWPFAWLPEAIPIQAVMSIAGLISSWFVNFVIRIGDRLEVRADDLVDGGIKKVLPFIKDKDPDNDER